MAFNINEFLHHIQNNNEVVRADKFDVIIAIPPGIKNPTVSPDGRDLALVCEVSSLPGREIQMIEYKQYGFIQRLPHFNNYGVASFTFICTGNMMEKSFFDQWLEAMIPAADGLVQYPWDSSGTPQYHTTITCQQYDMTNHLVYVVNLIEAIPVTVGSMIQDWSNDQILRLQVNFGFKKMSSSYVPIDTITPPASNFLGSLESAPSTNFNAGIPTAPSLSTLSTSNPPIALFSGKGGKFGGGGATGSF